MGLRIRLKQTSSFERLWEMLMWYISLKFQYKNYSLNFWKLSHEWCVQRNKGLSKNRFKIEISIKILGYSVKFNVRKKKEKDKKSMGLREMLFFCRGWTKKLWRKLWWLAKICVYRENVLDEKRFPSVLKVWLGKMHQENEGCFQELPPDAYFVRVRLGWSIQRIRGSRGVTQPARFQGSTRIREAAHCHWSRIWTTNL